jgi:hypothetical protein
LDLEGLARVLDESTAKRIIADLLKMYKGDSPRGEGASGGHTSGSQELEEGRIVRGLEGSQGRSPRPGRVDSDPWGSAIT